MNKNQLITKNTSYFLRGIAMLMVVMSHYVEWGESFIANKNIVEFISKLGDPGVGIFFFLSGYALYKGYKDNNGQFEAKKYLLSRIKGVYIPYLLIAGVTGLIDGVFDSPKAILRYLTGADYWFMEVIFIIYIAYFLVGLLPKWRVFLMTVFIIDLSLWLYISGYAEFWYDANWCFALGLIVSKYDEQFSIVKKGFAINIKDFLFCFIGKISLFIYILHTFVYMKIVNTLLAKEVKWIIATVLAFIVTALVGFLIKLILDNVYKLFLRK